MVHLCSWKGGRYNNHMEENKLKYISPTLTLIINHYIPYRFEYSDWFIYDQYNNENQSFPEYKIIIESRTLNKHEDLYQKNLEGYELIKIISQLMPFCTYNSFGRSEMFDIVFLQESFNSTIPAYGWKSNYKEVYLAMQESKLKVIATFAGYMIKTNVDNSPLRDLERMIVNYTLLDDNKLFLIFLLNSALESTDLNRYLILGKALEIIDAMYPNKNSKDDRLNVINPLLNEVFKGKTIKDLRGLSNTRKETRHYIGDKNNVLPHQEMTENEKILYYNCIFNLVVCVIRQSFALNYSPYDFSK